ncbi:MAG: DUF2202 domain-containing protein [Actinomycetales bacterium]|nr:DUF2202 domain-containing protein [Actinomycetales bacterium]
MSGRPRIRGKGWIAVTASAVMIAVGLAMPAEAVTSITPATVTATQQLAVTEKLASDVYATVAPQFEVPILTNVAESESRHLAAIRELLAKRSITDPTSGDAVGVFDDPTVSARYVDLVAAARASLAQAAAVGIDIERGELGLLRTTGALPDLPRDVHNVVQNLIDGDTNHLDAFTSLHATAQGDPPGAVGLTLQTARVTAPPSGRYEVGTRLVLARQPVRTDAGVTVRWRATTETRARCEVRVRDGRATVELTRPGVCTVVGFAPSPSPDYLPYRVMRTYRAVP